MRKGFWLGLSLLGLLSGCGLPSFLVTPVANVSELDEIKVAPATRMFAGKIAIVEVEGTLMNVRSGGFMQSEENPLSLFVQELQAAEDDQAVKAVVLRVNSPGGSVTTSDTMYDALLRFKQRTHKPVIAAAQEVSASGAYYVSCGADKLYANPTSIVGSIGVIFETIDVKGTMDKLGIESEAIKSAELKDMGSPFKHLTDHERSVMQEMVDEYFIRFKTVVTTNRPITEPKTLALVTDGRVFSGERAKELGLIDEIGRLDDAIEMARQMAHADGGSSRDVQTTLWVYRIDLRRRAGAAGREQSDESQDPVRRLDFARRFLLSLATLTPEVSDLTIFLKHFLQLTHRVVPMKRLEWQSVFYRTMVLRKSRAGGLVAIEKVEKKSRFFKQSGGSVDLHQRIAAGGSSTAFGGGV